MWAPVRAEPFSTSQMPSLVLCVKIQELNSSTLLFPFGPTINILRRPKWPSSGRPDLVNPSPHSRRGSANTLNDWKNSIAHVAPNPYNKTNETPYSSLAVDLSLILSANFASARELKCRDLPTLFEFYLNNHYALHKIDDTLRKRTVDQFIKYLDPSKMTLLAQDVPEIKAEVSKVMDTMKAIVRRSTKLLSASSRVPKEVQLFVDRFLGDGYKLDETAELTVDSDLRDYPKSTEARENW